jgi:hypothetical protein
MEQVGTTTTRAKAAAAAAGAVMTFSAGIVAYGIVDSNIPASTGGGLVGLAAAAMMGLAKMRAWAVDTSAERSQLTEAIRQAEIEQTRYAAAQGALEEEYRRRHRDLEGERARCQHQVTATKAALDEQYEARREALIVKSMEIGIRLHLAGLLDAPTETVEAKILRLPGQQPARVRTTAHPADAATQPAREREARHP